MEIYRVGGSVRDELLGRPSKDMDYVVVGSNHDEMTSLGYTMIGKDFPVYLHPETKDEYALSRQERLSNGKFEERVSSILDGMVEKQYFVFIVDTGTTLCIFDFEKKRP